MGTGTDHRSGRSCSTGGTAFACHAACWAVPEISTSRTLPAASAGTAGTMGGVTESSAPAPTRVSAVPRRMRQLLALAAVVVVVAMTVVALTLRSSSTGVVHFGTVDQVSLFGVGLVIAGGLLFLGRARVDADATGIRFRNFALDHDLPWTAVRAVAFERKSPWAALVLRNGDEVA